MRQEEDTPMKTSITNIPPIAEKKDQNGVASFARKVMLVYFGVLAMTIEEGYAFISRLPEHVKAAERKGREVVDSQKD